MGVSYATGAIVRTGEERATLVRRTYSVVFGSVLLTVLGVMVGFTQPALMETVAAHPFLTFFALFIPLLIAQARHREFPINITMVGLYTFGMGVWLSPLMYFYSQSQPGLITQAGGLTLGAFGALTMYAFVSRRDFSAWGSFFIVGLFVLIGTMLLNMFFHNATADLWIAAMTIVVFSGLLIFDTWRLRNVYGPDQYVLAAVQIYLDLLNMFLAVLRLLGRRR